MIRAILVINTALAHRTCYNTPQKSKLLLLVVYKCFKKGQIDAILPMESSKKLNPNCDLLPDYAELQSTGYLSDITIVIKEEVPDVPSKESASPQAKRSRVDQPQMSLPAHKVVLWGMSKFFQAKVRQVVPREGLQNQNSTACASSCN